ncbi:MAG: carboxypeptidase regulatory-like domain-containing protein [Acidobacteriota bacterium]
MSDIPLPEGLWELRLVDQRLWATSIHVRNVDAAAMRVWPTVPLEGTSNGVTRLRVRFDPLEPEGASGEVDCVVTLDAWTCRIPVGHYDLRFSAPGMAHEFRFGVTLSLDSGSGAVALRFVAGASLYGSVEAARDAKVPVEGTEVSLVQANGEGSQHQQKTRADRKGFFQFKGLAPGDYSLSAGKQGLVSQVRSVKMLSGVAAEVRTPLLLDTPKRLMVTVMPPLGPDGLAWRMRMFSRDPQLRGSAWEGRVSAVGEWAVHGLVAGQYDIQILGPENGLWKSEEVTIGSQDVTVAMAALAMKISGRIALGERPLTASLSFGGEGGPKLQSDEDGRFDGEIPPDQDEEIRILVEADTPRVVRTVRTKIERTDSGEARLMIELPDTALMGVVLNEDRSPEPHAILNVTRDELESFEQTHTESDGSFQLGGFDPGSYRVTAISFEKKSRAATVELKKNEATEVELILAPEVMLRGRMTMGNTPVIGAQIQAMPRDAWAPTGDIVTTDERGMFRFPLPPGTTIFDGIAVHPAFDTVIARGSIKPGREVWVQTNQLGGTVTVESSRPDQVLFIHKGAEITLEGVAFLAGGIVTPERVTLPRLEPGEYSVCSPDKKSCVSGYLAPHSTLTLTPDSSTK